jgi:hypothetical protein
MQRIHLSCIFPAATNISRATYVRGQHVKFVRPKSVHALELSPGVAPGFSEIEFAEPWAIIDGWMALVRTVTRKRSHCAV